MSPIFNELGGVLNTAAYLDFQQQVREAEEMYLSASLQVPQPLLNDFERVLMEQCGRRMDTMMLLAHQTKQNVDETNRKVHALALSLQNVQSGTSLVDPTPTAPVLASQGVVPVSMPTLTITNSQKPREKRRGIRERHALLANPNGHSRIRFVSVLLVFKQNHNSVDCWMSIGMSGENLSKSMVQHGARMSQSSCWMALKSL
jgi:hypothetical protein